MLLSDNCRVWWKFSSLRSINHSSGVNTWHFQFLFCSSFIPVILIGSFFDLILSYRSSVPGRWSIGCIGCILAFLCKVVCLPTCLTVRTNSFWLSFWFVTVFVLVVILICTVVWNKFIGATVFVSRIILSIFRLLFLTFVQTALISVMSGFFCSGGTLVWVSQHLRLQYCGLQYYLVAHQGIPISSNSLFRCVTICSYVPISKWA